MGDMLQLILALGGVGAAMTAVAVLIAWACWMANRTIRADYYLVLMSRFGHWGRKSIECDQGNTTQ